MLHGGLFLVRRVAAGMGIVCLFRYLVESLVRPWNAPPAPLSTRAALLLVLIIDYLPNGVVHALMSLLASTASGPET